MQTSQNVSSGYVLSAFFLHFYSSIPRYSSFSLTKLVVIAAVFAIAGQVPYVHCPDPIEICNVSHN